MFTKVHWSVLWAVVFCLVLDSATVAQTDVTTVKLAVPEPYFPQYQSVVLPQVEEAFPNLRVELVPRVQIITRPNPFDEEKFIEYLDTLEFVANSADVILVSKWFYGIEAIQTGFFLDLRPLALTDPDMNFDDFLPTVQDAFQWSGGLWALPIGASPVMTIYDPAAFDEAALKLPDETWSFEDYINAARNLAVYDSAGNAVEPGLLILDIDLPLFFYSLTLQSDHDANDLPQFTSDEVADLLTQWIELESEGIVTTSPPAGIMLDELPLAIGRSSTFQQEVSLRGALLPNGVVGVDASGFVISKGTNNAEAVYELVKFLSTIPEIGAFDGVTVPARQSALVDFTLPGMQGSDVPAETQDFVIETLKSGSSVPLLYSTYMQQAWSLAHSTSASEALFTAQGNAETAMNTAIERGQSTIVSVAPPVPLPDEDGVVINFGIWGTIGDSNRLKDIAREFARDDPQVVKVNLNAISAGYPSWYEDMYMNNDCLYTGVPSSSGWLTQLRDLTPLIESDGDFNMSDMLPGVLETVRREGKIWGIPMTIETPVLRYHRDPFNQYGITIPEDGWTIDEFLEILRTLEDAGQDQPPFYSLTPTSKQSLYFLIAAYGGTPFDYTTNLPTPMFTDPETVEAIRETLDLARDGLMKYEQTARQTFTLGLPRREPLLIDDWLYPRLSSENQDPMKPAYYVYQDYDMALFPTGAYTPVYFQSSSVLITQTATHPEACYRWAKTLLEHPEVFTGMPAYYSLIDAPATLASRGEDQVEVYQKIMRYVSSPNAFVIEPYFGDWFLRRAFDRYVILDADLETELAEAEIFTRAYANCYPTLSVEELKDFPLRCIFEADPSLTVEDVIWGMPGFKLPEPEDE